MSLNPYFHALDHVDTLILKSEIFSKNIYVSKTIPPTLKHFNFFELCHR